MPTKCLKRDTIYTLLQQVSYFKRTL